MIDSPQQRVDAACTALGRGAVVACCRDLLAGRPPDDVVLAALGGPGLAHVLSDESGTNDYWLRVWGARGLLWAWDPVALPELLAGTTNPAWRVREMVAKVVARHRVDEALDVIAALRVDAVPRVRAAAERALSRLAAPPTP